MQAGMSSSDDSDGHDAPLLAGGRRGGAYRGFGGSRGFALMCVTLVTLQTADGSLCVLLFDVWGDRYSIFINQGGAFVYIVWSMLALGVLRWRERKHAPHAVASRAGKPAARPAPSRVLVAIGLMNGSANFCMAIAQPHTPGLTQTILLLLGVPLVLAISWLALGKKPSAVAALAALLIVVGSAFSGLRTVLQPAEHEPVVVFAWAILLFAAAQLFLAAEKVVEDVTFGTHARVHPMVMFCWTLVTQFCLGWALYPLQTIPALGGLHLGDLPAVLHDGVYCTLGLPPCGTGHALIFWAYTCVDFWCYYFGVRSLALQRRGRALQLRAPCLLCRHAACSLSA
jgi:drug/metabolite transporter (DMT)-like permease